MTRCHKVDSLTGAKLGPPTPATSSRSNHRASFTIQSSGTITSSSVNRISSESVAPIATLQASARVREPSSSTKRTPAASATALPGSFRGPTTIISSGPEYVCSAKPSRTMANSFELRTEGIITQTLGLLTPLACPPLLSSNLIFRLRILFSGECLNFNNHSRVVGDSRSEEVSPFRSTTITCPGESKWILVLEFKSNYFSQSAR